MNDTPQPTGRRDWLLNTLIGAVTATVAFIFYPAVRFLWPREVTTSGQLSVVAPYTVDKLKLDAEGNWPPPFNFGGKPCLVILTPDGDVKAFNALCTHTDCTVQYLPEKSEIFCGCHNGVYNLNGQNVSGPPPRPLEEYKVTLEPTKDGQNIIVSRA